MSAKVTIELNGTCRIDCDLCGQFYEGPVTAGLVITPIEHHFAMGLDPILKSKGWGFLRNPKRPENVISNEPPYIVVCPNCLKKAADSLERESSIPVPPKEKL